MNYAIILEENIKNHFTDIFVDDIQFFDDDTNVYDIEYQSGDNLFIHFDSITAELDDIVKYLKELSQKVNIIALKNNPNVVEGAYLLKNGFKSYINSRTNKIIMQQVLNTVKNGNVWAYPELMSFIVTKIDVTPTYNNSDKINSLSMKETEVASLITQGFTNKKIAQTMNIAEVTVKKHLTSIFHKLDVKDRVSLVVYLK